MDYDILGIGTFHKDLKMKEILHIENLMQPGDIILTRNLKEEDNSSPGFWNHAAIHVGNGIIIEAQAEPNKVLEVGWYEFADRYPTILVIRFPIDNIDKMTNRAKSLLGTKYRKISSIFMFMGPIRNYLGNNCVSVVSQCYKAATNENTKWKIPDDILKTKHKKIWEKLT